jgi:hypothetical protein
MRYRIRKLHFPVSTFSNFCKFFALIILDNSKICGGKILIFEFPAKKYKIAQVTMPEDF